MNLYHDNKEWMTRILDLLSAHFGPDVEFVIHDLTLDYEHTIVDIRNGQITGRKVGDTGDALGLQVIRGTIENDEEHFFQNTNFTQDGKTLRSSTVFLRDKKGKIVACVGINEDITKSVELEQYLHSRNYVPVPGSMDINEGRGDVNKILDYLIDSAQMMVGKNTSIMTKEDKLSYIDYLDKRGAFLITKSGPRVCEALGISKYTLYNYLDIVRKNKEQAAD
ncbi:MAG: helix-turn-helix transcriptional regulator [Bacillota bacterium]|nr:helix-turn-helix transcriptional regulator [Bacillota bacterium]